MSVTVQGTGTKTNALGTFTVTIATPGVFTYTAHGLTAGDKVTLATTGALPTGLTAGTVYYVIATGLSANDFRLALTDGGAAINTTGSQSGTHTLIAEEIVLDIAAAGMYTFQVSCANMADLDSVEFRVYAMVLTGGAREVLWMGRVYGGQTDDTDLLISPPFASELTDAGALRVTLKQTNGTARAFPWKVLKYA